MIIQKRKRKRERERERERERKDCGQCGQCGRENLGDNPIDCGQCFEKRELHDESQPQWSWLTTRCIVELMQGFENNGHVMSDWIRLKLAANRYWRRHCFHIWEEKGGEKVQYRPQRLHESRRGGAVSSVIEAANQRQRRRLLTDILSAVLFTPPPRRIIN